MGPPSGALLRSGFAFGGLLADITQGPEPFEVDAPMSRDERFMLEALRESMRSVGHASPNPAVGCVVVKNGVIIARGRTHPPGGPHAERDAMSALSSAASGPESQTAPAEQAPQLTWPEGSEVYVTLEPCSFFGRTPPCTELFEGARNVRVVVGCIDPNPRVSGSGLRVLQAHGLEVVSGVLAPEIAATLMAFTRDMMQARSGGNGLGGQRPFVGLKWAQSIDGKMADTDGLSQWLTGSKAARYSHWLRQKYDAVAVGWNTFVQDRPRLTVRELPSGMVPRHPVRVVFDPQARFAALAPDEGMRLFRSETEPPPPQERTERGQPRWLVFESSDAASAVDYDAGLGVLRVSCPARQEVSWLQQCLAWLVSREAEVLLGRPIQSLMVEGGPRLHGQFYEQGLFDVMHGWIAPLWLGQSRYAWLHESSKALHDAERMHLLQAQPLGNDVLCEWVPLERP